MVLPPLKYTCMPHIFQTFTKAFCIWYHLMLQLALVLLLVGFLLLLFSFVWLGALILFLILFKAHPGYLHLVRTFCRCFCSSSSFCEVEHTALAL